MHYVQLSVGWREKIRLRLNILKMQWKKMCITYHSIYTFEWYDIAAKAVLGYIIALITFGFLATTLIYK